MAAGFLLNVEYLVSIHHPSTSGANGMPEAGHGSMYDLAILAEVGSDLINKRECSQYSSGYLYYVLRNGQ